jgi:hemolysin activation/secretion protein
LFNFRYNYLLERMGVFDPRLSFGLDWRDYQRIELTNPPPTVLYNEIVVVPLSAAYAATGKFAKSDVNFNLSLVANIPGANKGKAADFAAYDQVNLTNPEPNYKLLRYGLGYSRAVGNGWLFRTVLNGQWSSDVLVQGEQIRLGGADAVRGFSEGSEGGDSGARLNLEWYTPDFGKGELRTRALVFFDAGHASLSANSGKVTISSAGIGIRASYSERFSLRCDAATIEKAGTDPEQQAGDWRVNLSLNATF